MGEETDERRGAFFAASRKAWEMGVVEVLNTLEQEMIGPFALGEEIVSCCYYLSTCCVADADVLFRSVSLSPTCTSSPGSRASSSSRRERPTPRVCVRSKTRSLAAGSASEPLVELRVLRVERGRTGQGASRRSGPRVRRPRRPGRRSRSARRRGTFGSCGSKGTASNECAFLRFTVSPPSLPGAQY